MTGFARKGLRLLWYALAALVLLMALGGAAASWLLPMAERHPQRVADWLGERVGHKVAFDHLETDWTRRGPLLRLDGLRIGEGAQAVTVGEAEVLVAQYAGLLPGRSLTELRLRNLDLTLVRDDAGRWQVRGLPGQDSAGDPFAMLERLGELQVIGGSLGIDAPALGLHATVPDIDLRLRVNGDRVQVAGRARMRAGAEPVRAAARFNRRSGDGELYVGTRNADIPGWSPLLRHAGVTLERGQGRADTWLDLHDARITGVTARLALEDVGLRGTSSGETDDDVAQAGFDRLAAEVTWRRRDDGWRIDIPRLHATRAGEAWRIEALSAALGAGHALLAERIEVAPLLSLLALSDRPDPALRQWLHAAAPNAVLEQVALAGTEDGRLRMQMRVAVLEFASVGERPGLEGVRGDLAGDAQGAVFRFDPQARLRFDWPAGFGDVHEIALEGDVAVWPGDDGWQVQTPALRVDGDGYGADVRGGLRFRGDGARPWIDMVAALDDVQIPVAKRFWVRHKMSAAAVQWLDDALEGGWLRNGRAVVSGGLADWPFDAAQDEPARGLFHAQGEIDAGRIRFQPDWPLADNMHGRVRFIADGFDFRGEARLAGVEVRGLEAGIADFGRPDLEVSARTRSDAGQVLGLLQASPLAVEQLAQLQMQGVVSGDFGMRLPLHAEHGSTQIEGTRIEGTVSLEDVQAIEPEWSLALEGMHGQLTYDAHGFSGPSLQVRHQGRPGRLTLRAGEGHVRDAENGFEGELQARISVEELLAQAQQMDWLSAYADGRSEWRVGVYVPRQEDGTGGAILRLDSDLAGTALTLPVPLDKPAPVRLPTRVEVPLPLGSGDVSVRMGQRMALRARTGADAVPAVRVTMGGAETMPPTRGLEIDGSTALLAPLDWVGLVAGGDGDGLSLGRIDLEVDRLLLGGGGFGPVRIHGDPDDEGTRLHFEGEGLAGALTLPDARNAAIEGHFQRMYWGLRGSPDMSAEGQDRPDAATAVSTVDPAGIPSIRLSVEDLRIEQAALGTATLVTRQTAEGMHVERLETSASQHHVTATGDWSGHHDTAHTRLDVRVASADFGELLAGLGQAGRIRGGDGQIRLDVAWPGSPASPRPEAMDAALQLSVRNGQLIDVEPGAGRLLGLLSVAELPRRLSLDFRDFFERGFAFNLIEGDIQAASGRAYSDNLTLDGPAARIHIAGAADLHARTYDQTIEVLPKSGNVLTAVGAITAGPVGAAVGAVANAMLRRPLSELGATSYRVTGPWKEPEVEVVRREAPRPPDQTVPQSGQDTQGEGQVEHPGLVR